MSFTYKTIKASSNGIYKEKGSKFLSFAFPISTVEQAKELIDKHKKEYFDARHVCYAYMLGNERDTFRANDDGEPSGTAGKPILGQLNSHQLSDILVIVVRYFGGVLLGIGGLTTAYKEAANDAITNAELIEKTVKANITIRFDYLILNDIMNISKLLNAQILEQEFDNECRIKIAINKADEANTKAKLEQLSIHSPIHIHFG
jgi:uncharacterized YigZ family protein